MAQLNVLMSSRADYSRLRVLSVLFVGVIKAIRTIPKMAAPSQEGPQKASLGQRMKRFLVGDKHNVPAAKPAKPEQGFSFERTSPALFSPDTVQSALLTLMDTSR